MDCAVDELMVAALAREIPDGAVVQVGAGVPLCLAAATLAKATHAPNATLFPQGISGLEGRRPFTITLRGLEGAAYGARLAHDIAGILNRTEGQGAFEPLAPAQVDREGNFNTVVIGPYHRPRVRLPGLAGVDILGTMDHPVVLYTTRHTPQVLVDRVDFVMAAGRRRRVGAGGSPRGGPHRLITNLAVLDLDESGTWSVTSLHPGVTWEAVRRATGFALAGRPQAGTTPPPSPEVLRLLRERIDPFGLRRLEFVPARERRKALLGIIAAERAWLEQKGLACW